ncbi:MULTISPECIES: hypothetical protein [Paraburkholderia]|jgi:hypothetical protein|uniref:Uncharacterized protein n=1 Tax=Paraburkholderia phenazinium TaxID=60549 RepID=A0A1N6FJM0_9BURK|nr:hypothetical protein [Paraburkholderia phenazinium]SIN95493.1 hypothetical protein SAMN05444168_1627 [Paraburkholderia phenazinium]
MNASTQMTRQHRPGNSRTALVCVLVSGLAAGAAIPAAAQVADAPGNLIIQSTVTPRDAFVPVPKADDPIAVQVQTFPTGAFDSAMGAMVSDTDLTRAHGTSGVTGGSFMPALVGSNGIEHLLAGNGTVAGSGIPVGAGASLGGIGGIGGSIAQTVTGALAPLGAAMGAMK